MATIKDIAREAGVSYTTVSNVIHGRTSRASAQTIERINEIIKKLNYTPNMSARSLVSQVSKVVAIINNLVPKQSGSFLEDPFHNTFIGAIEESLRQNGYYLMIRTIEDPQSLLSFLHNWNVDGLFLTGVFEDDALFETLKDLRMPIVLTDSYLSDLNNMVCVGLEDFRGGYIATKYLIDNNHKSIAFACPPIHGVGVVMERLNGYKKALSEANIDFDENLVFEREFTFEETAALGAYIAKREDITAVFATADIMAAGIMAGLQKSGRKVPDDISVIGFDDISLCQMTMPTLTTIHQDSIKKGQIAADLMMKALNGETISKEKKILPVNLCIRDSVKRIS